MVLSQEEIDGCREAFLAFDKDLQQADETEVLRGSDDRTLKDEDVLIREKVDLSISICWEINQRCAQDTCPRWNVNRTDLKIVTTIVYDFHLVGGSHHEQGEEDCGDHCVHCVSILIGNFRD